MSILRGASTPYPADASIPSVFAAQVRARPDAPAVVDGGHTLTYAELDARSDRLAGLLRGRGVTEGSRVGVLLERGHQLVTALLAILKAGGAYVPVDPAHPTERREHMLAAAEAAVTVTAEELRLAERAHRAEQTEGAERAEDLIAPPLPGAGSRVPAYILFTSGSTGRPKGVVVEHRSVLRLVRDTDYVDLGADERIAQVADSSFDAFTFEVWGALLNGGAVVVIPTRTVLTPGALARALAEHRITTMFLTSALFTAVMADRPDSFAGLRTLLVGGDALNVAAVRRLLGLDPAARPGRLLNGYGPTEATTFAVCGKVTALAADARSVPIGRPIANTDCYVLGEDLAPVAAGEPGELFIGGPGVARGYAGQPELTGERFPADPYATEPGARMYRTGDLVRVLPDGRLDFLGRADDQVKIRGYRVEPGEVEAALRLHPEVREVAVVADDSTGERRLVAHLSPVVPGERPAGLREFLSGRLPEWLVPAAFVVVPALPLTTSGKVDRAALPPVPADGEDVAAVPPRTGLERELAAIAAELLGLASVGVTDDFFALGGHSLLAMRLLSRVDAAFDVRVDLGEYLYDPTIERLAAEVSAARANAGTGTGAGTGAEAGAVGEPGEGAAEGTSAADGVSP
ncbi:amino acid adenylation domain-containing protein [Streptomyces sp. NPDC090025]|uniref:amino acid adenylation domain-containing protein n=1 Tax=Streptomyces sp. NPDC090025 TaxID=3365922 RepID=UPI0038324347